MVRSRTNTGNSGFGKKAGLPSGRMSRVQKRRGICGCGVKSSPQTLIARFREIDTDNDGFISVNELATHIIATVPFPNGELPDGNLGWPHRLPLGRQRCADNGGYFSWSAHWRPVYRKPTTQLRRFRSHYDWEPLGHQNHPKVRIQKVRYRQ